MPEGGLVSLVRVFVARIYPVVFMEKNAGDKTLFRSERYYRKTVENVASDYERMMEKIVEDVERETDEEERKRRRINGNRSDFNLTDEEKSRKIQVEARKRMEQALSTRKQVFDHFYISFVNPHYSQKFVHLIRKQIVDCV